MKIEEMICELATASLVRLEVYGSDKQKAYQLELRGNGIKRMTKELVDYVKFVDGPPPAERT